MCNSGHCLGRIISPAQDTEYLFWPGSTPNITWRFDNSVPPIYYPSHHYRVWHFTRIRIRDGSTSSEEMVAHIYDDDVPEIRWSNLSGVNVGIEKPATLILKNVDQSYNGVYQFTVYGEKRRVRVFIAGKQ